MKDPRLTNLAEILVNYSVDVKPGEWVVIHADLVTAPMAEEIYRLVLEAGGYPTSCMAWDRLSEVFFQTANENQLTWISPTTDLIYRDVDVSIDLWGAENTRSLSGINPQRISKRQAATRELSNRFMKRSAEGSLRWVLGPYPNNAHAQEADMSLSDYEDFVYCATFADREDPVAEWQSLHQQQQVIVDWLKGKEKLTAQGPHLDLSMSIADRVFINCDGKLNMPDGEIFTGPVEDSVNGWIEFTYPAIYMGREVEDVRLEFKDGKVVSGSATKNEDTLLSQLEVDAGARFVGEFAIGTNAGINRFTKNMLFDEKMGGTVHLALGAAYPETGSKNESGIHWDMLCDAKKDTEIRVDGDLLYKDGEFMI